MRAQPRAIVVAGGKGTRLAPYTATLPKPLVPLGDMPILEILLRQLARAGLRHVTLTVNHLAALLQAYFGDGSRFGLAVDYALEETPLGTAGPLAGVAGLDTTFVVLNGDLLTDLDYGAMLAQHRRTGATVTVGLYERTHTVDFGVVDTDDSGCITGYREKPAFQYRVSMGVYVMEPAALTLIPRGQRFDLPDLVNAMLAADQRVHTFLHHGYWLDIGRPDDYQRAQEDFPALRQQLLGT
ncbi:MAG: sugar phosphate nucleotidyltransferase [Gammaproteobacteria bacterium]